MSDSKLRWDDKLQFHWLNVYDGNVLDIMDMRGLEVSAVIFYTFAISSYDTVNHDLTNMNMQLLDYRRCDNLIPPYSSLFRLPPLCVPGPPNDWWVHFFFYLALLDLAGYQLIASQTTR